MTRQRLALIATALLCVACTPGQSRVPSESLQTVPKVTGESVADARNELESAGFLVQIVPVGATPPPAQIKEEPAGKCASGTVTEQDPPPDEEVLKAQTIVLTASGC